MTLRAILAGILFAFFISIVVYFNDQIIRQTFLIGNHFPIIVFGLLILLVIAVNPLLKRLRIIKPLSSMEIAVIGALGLCVCGWPGSGYFRGFTGLVVNPSNQVRMNASWKAAHVMSYVPGASYLLGEGHVRDWSGFTRMLVEKGNAAGDCPARRLWDLMPGNARAVALSTIQRPAMEPGDKAVLLAAINDVLSRPDFWDEKSFSGVLIEPRLRAMLESTQGGQATEKDIQKANRMLLVASFPGVIVPPPPGKGVLLADSDIQSPAVQNLLLGKEGAGRVGLSAIPWDTWFPTLFIWGGLAILLGTAAVCLAIIFQPQWKRELLPFPIARFITDLTHSEQPDGTPSALKNKMFWYAFTAIIIIHLVNGLHVWFPNFIEIPLRFDFSALQQLFPRGRQVDMGWLIAWNPQFYPTVIAIAFFLSAEVSFSLGISGFLYMAFMSLMMASGVAMERDYIDSGNENLIRFGSYLGITIMFLYTGRHYYANVLLGSIGFRRQAETPASALWASRLLIITIVVSVLLLTRYGVNWFFGLPLIASILLMSTVISRVNAETGSFFMQPYWMPLGVMTALFGVKAIGPTAYVVMAMMCMIMTGDPREIVMPFVTNALYMGTDSSEKKPDGRFSLLVGVMVAAGFCAALFATLYFQYNKGINSHDSWAMQSMPGMVFDHLTLRVSELSAYGELSQSVAATGLAKLSFLSPDYVRISWAAFGLALVIACSLLRLKFSWWPLHPVAFIVFGTYPGAYFAPSFLIGWLVKIAVVKLSGAKGFRSLRPLMIGLIAGELFAAIGWSVFGTLYFLATDLIPKSYRIFPG